LYLVIMSRAFYLLSIKPLCHTIWNPF